MRVGRVRPDADPGVAPMFLLLLIAAAVAYRIDLARRGLTVEDAYFYAD